MKKILFLFFIIFSFHPSLQAQQNLWQRFPLKFNYFPRIMYFDSTENACYIAGAFSKVNDSSCNIVKWDGNSYTLLPPSPLNSTSCIIRYNNKLYVGGYGYPVNLACWDGHSWTSLDSSNALILCFTKYQNKLLIGGDFSSLANTGIGSVASWNGNVWNDVDGVDTLLGSSGWYVQSIVEFKGELYIAGNFNNLTDTSINEIARFDGTRWKNVGGFKGSNLASINKLLVWKDTMYVGGIFNEATSSPGNSIAMWDGNHWKRLNSGLGTPGGMGGVTDISVFNDNVYATGAFSIIDGITYPGISHLDFAKWDGQRWCTMGTKPNNVIFTMGQFRDSLYIMGGFDTLNNQPMWHMAKWIGGDYTDSCSQPVPAGVSEISSDNKVSLLVFPNPAQNILNVKYYNPEINSGNALITVTDLLGRHILSKNIKIKQGENLWHLNTAAIPPGIYFLEINNAERKSIAKFVKQ